MGGTVTKFLSTVSAVGRGIGRALRARPGAALLAMAGVLALDVLLPPLLLSVTRKPWTFFTFNPWLKRLPEYLVSSTPWTEKLDFLGRVALFWFSADGPYGQPEWGIKDVEVNGMRVAVYVALWLDRRAAGVSSWRAGSGRAGGGLAAAASVLGLSTGPCSVVGCGAPVLPVVALMFAGLSSTTLALLSQVSRISAISVVVALLVAITWLGWRAGARARV